MIEEKNRRKNGRRIYWKEGREKVGIERIIEYEWIERKYAEESVGRRRKDCQESWDKKGMEKKDLGKIGM